MYERLLLAQVPKQDIIIIDDIPGSWGYYNNVIKLLEEYSHQFNFNNCLFITSSEQSTRVRKILEKHLSTVKIVLSENYEYVADWGKRVQLFRRVANEMFIAIPLFYLSGRI